ncbi:hypothetical protein [Microcoleus sp. B4-D4]|uniref:hypothetical protein n=1 Tax=Microcoleus sp. B4-D4 TaxID=2818667 RepID=UPI002FD2445E
MSDDIIAFEGKVILGAKSRRNRNYDVGEKINSVIVASWVSETADNGFNGTASCSGADARDYLT